MSENATIWLDTELPTLDGNDYAVLSALASLATPSGIVTVTQTTLAKQCFISQSNVNDRLKSLNGVYLIKIKLVIGSGRGSRPNTYVIAPYGNREPMLPLPETIATLVKRALADLDAKEIADEIANGTRSEDGTLLPDDEAAAIREALAKYKKARGV
jgi:hypothetical protein